MNIKIKKVMVLGSGVMGSAIAAHFANIGIPSYLLDIVPPKSSDDDKKRGLTENNPQFRNRIAQSNLEKLRKAKPAPFYEKDFESLITCGNFDDNLNWVSEVDWVIEAVLEKLDVKRALFSRVLKHWKEGTILSTNTSGISINQISEGFTENQKKHFLGTHFFNPPRYMKLLEIIPTEKTDPEIVRFISHFGERSLGKGIVYAKDTPNFIANRIGIFGMMDVMRLMVLGKYTVPEIDAITGPALGRPKSASFRTADLVGIDTFCHVAKNVYDSLPNDESRNIFILPDFLKKMVEGGLIGDKSGQGFYKKVRGEKKEILAIDYEKLEYYPTEKPKFGSIETSKNFENTDERIRSVVYAKDRAGEFAWKNISNILLYSANRIPEISDDIVNIDRAMKWGFNWELGPFEIWDAIGVQQSVEMMGKEGKKIPEFVKELVASGKNSFYKSKNGKNFYFDVKTLDYKEVEKDQKIILLSPLKEQSKIIKKNAGASLIDIGDDVLCLEFHSKMNSIGQDIISLMKEAVKLTEANYRGLVIGNEGENFSVGANLMMLLLEAQEGNWDEIDLIVREFQSVNMLLKYCVKPVVIAPFGITLGGGCEVVLHGSRVRALAETYIGLVEVGVGVIPAGGGTKEMLIRNMDLVPKDVPVDPFPYVRKAFETIGMAKVATSAYEARNFLFLRPEDSVTTNKDFLIQDAKNDVLAMSLAGYKPPRRANKILAQGESALSTIKMALYNMKEGGYISEYDAFIGEKLMYILAGGNHIQKREVTEDYILDLEKEVFLSLCGQRKTQERMQYMLKNGKPLRN